MKKIYQTPATELVKVVSSTSMLAGSVNLSLLGGDADGSEILSREDNAFTFEDDTFSFEE